MSIGLSSLAQSSEFEASYAIEQSGDTKVNSQKQPGNMLFAWGISGAMAMAIVFGLDVLQLVDSLNVWILNLFSEVSLNAPAHRFPKVVHWLVSGVSAFALTFVILSIRGSWRRVLVFGVTLTLTIFCAPVMFLANVQPEIGHVFIAISWSGFCSIFYASSHCMPVDRC